VAAGLTGVASGGLAIAAAASSSFWGGIALAAIALALPAMTALIIFGRNDEPLRRVLRIIQALRK
jgi:hypothetical protein